MRITRVRKETVALQRREYMHAVIWKGLIILGLGMAFAGLLCMIEAQTYRTKDGKKYKSIHTDIKPEMSKVGWVLTIGGYVYQIVGVISS